MSDLFSRRLVFVMGKGGVGKTTVAAALGLVAARSGRRTLVCEVSEQERITAVFGCPPAGFEETEIAENLSSFSVNPIDAREEWLRHQLHSGALAGLVNGSRLFSYLAAAGPGLAEVVTLGKVWELAQLERRAARSRPYDLVVVDAPATGHGLAMLRSPRTFAEIARVGPVHRHARAIEKFVADPEQTAVVTVALAEEMPVNETLDLEARLHEQIGLELDRVLVNAVLPERFSGAEAEALEAAEAKAKGPPAEALGAALAAHERGRGQRSQLARLRRGLQAPVATLPHLLVPEVEREDLERLSVELERKL